MLQSIYCDVTGLTIEVINPKLPNIIWAVPHPLSILPNAVTYLRHCIHRKYPNFAQKQYLCGAILTILVKKNIVVDKLSGLQRRKTLERVSTRALLRLAAYLINTSEATQEKWPLLSLEEQNPSTLYTFLRIISGEEIRLEQRKNKKELESLFEILDDDNATNDTTDDKKEKPAIYQKRKEQQDAPAPVKAKMQSHINTLEDTLFGNLPTSLSIAEILAKKRGM